MTGDRRDDRLLRRHGPGDGRSRGVLIGAMSLALAVSSASAQTQTPRFQSSVEVTSLDVYVVDDRGRPIAGLSPDDFVVTVDGEQRRVLSAQWLTFAPDVNAVQPFVPEGYSTNTVGTGGRMIVIAVDLPSLRPNSPQMIVSAASSFIDRLGAADRAAVVKFGSGASSTPFTSNRERLKEAVSDMIGEWRSASGYGGHMLTPAEAIAVMNADQPTADYIYDRECPSLGRSQAGLVACRTELELQAAEISGDAARGSDHTIRGLSSLFGSLRAMDGPKTVVLISDGFGAVDLQSVVDELASMATAARVRVYAIQPKDDSAGMTAFGARGLRGDFATRDGSLELLASSTGGALFTIANSSPAMPFDTIQSELSGYYLLGLESDPRDRDGKVHAIRVDVPRRGAVVRAHRQLANAGADALNRSPRQMVAAGLNSPLLMSALPLRVTTLSLQGPERDKVQLLVHADIGVDYSSTKTVSVGFVILDANGERVGGRTVDASLQPVMDGVPSGLQFSAGASLPPGDYTLKLAAAEGDRAGSVEHPIHATLTNVDNVTLSELIVGGPAGADERLTPTVGYTANFGLVHGYLEAYGPLVDAVTVKYEIAADATSPALLTSEVPGRLSGDDRMIFTRIMPVLRLPPGKYVLRASVVSAAKPVKTLLRGFELAAPPVLLTSAEGTGAAPAAEAELFLPVDEQAVAQPFRRDEALSAETLRLFRDRLAPAITADFEAGVSALAAGDYPKAEASLKRAIRPDVDSTAAMAYLAVTFAAAGRDIEAAGAWHTALAEGAELSQLYGWLSQALLRTRSLPEARGILEEAVAKWPADARFTRPLAMLHAIFGKGREAVRTLEHYLSARPDDREAYRMGVEWIYHAHAAGILVHNRVDDLKLARGYADAYEKANGPQVPLVRRWIEFLENEKR